MLANQSEKIIVYNYASVRMRKRGIYGSVFVCLSCVCMCVCVSMCRLLQLLKDQQEEFL